MTDWFGTATLALVSVQDSQPSVPGMPGDGGGAQPGTTLQPGTEGAGGTPAGAGPGGGNFVFIIAIAGMFILMLFMSGRAQRTERKKKQAMLDNMGKHDKVQTIGGLIGTVSEIRDDEIVLKVDESTKLTFAKSAVQQVVRPGDSSSKSDSISSAEPELASAINS